MVVSLYRPSSAYCIIKIALIATLYESGKSHIVAIRAGFIIAVADLPFVQMNRLTVIYRQMSCSLLSPLANLPLLRFSKI